MARQRQYRWSGSMFATIAMARVAQRRKTVAAMIAGAAG
jgi:hypothetical protein